MTVKDLKTALDQFPDDMNVFLSQTEDSVQYAIANSVRSKKLTFEPDYEEQNIVLIDIE